MLRAATTEDIDTRSGKRMFSFGASAGAGASGTSGAPAAPAAPAAATGGFSFGAPPAASSATPAPGTGAAAGSSGTSSTGGGLFSFGAPAASASAPAASAPAAAPATGGLFSFGGASAAPGSSSTAPSTGAAPAGGAGGFSFGSLAKPPTTTAAPALGGSLFGSASTGGTGLFGTSNNTAVATTTSQSQQQAGGGLFGSTLGGSTGGGLFGAKPAQPQQQPLGLSQQPGQGLLAQTLGASSAVSQQSTGAGGAALDPRKAGQPLNAKLDALYRAWDTNNIATCKFLHYFYNNVGAASLASLSSNPYAGRRHDALGRDHDALWSAAVAQNPDPSRLLPVLAVGFADLKRRHEAQQAEAGRHLAHMTVCAARLKELERKHALSNTVRHSAAQAKQAELHHRLLGFLRHAHLLIPSLRGTSIEPEEERLRAELEALEAEIEGTVAPGAGAGTGGAAADAQQQQQQQHMHAGRLRARLNEFWAQIGALRAKRDALARRTGGAGAGSGAGAGADGHGAVQWAVVDQAEVDRAAQILAVHASGLSHLSDTLASDVRALDIICKGLEGVKLVGVKGGAPINGDGSRPRESL